MAATNGFFTVPIDNRSLHDEYCCSPEVGCSVPFSVLNRFNQEVTDNSQFLNGNRGLKRKAEMLEEQQPLKLPSPFESSSVSLQAVINQCEQQQQLTSSFIVLPSLHQSTPQPFRACRERKQNVTKGVVSKQMDNSMSVRYSQIKDKFFTYGELVKFFTYITAERKPSCSIDLYNLIVNLFGNRKTYLHLRWMLTKIYEEGVRINPDLRNNDYNGMLKLLLDGKLMFLSCIRYSDKCSKRWSYEQELQLVNSVIENRDYSEEIKDWSKIAESIDGKKASEASSKWFNQYNFLDLWSLSELKNIIAGYLGFQKEKDVWIRICDRYFKRTLGFEYLRWPEQVKDKWGVILREYHKYIKDPENYPNSVDTELNLGDAEDREINFEALDRFVTYYCYKFSVFRENKFYLY